MLIEWDCNQKYIGETKGSYNTSGSQTFSHHVPFVGPILSPRTTLLQENSICQISFDQKFGKPELTQMRHEDNGCEKL